MLHVGGHSKGHTKNSLLAESIIMASPFDRIEDGFGIPQHSISQPDPDAQTLQPLAFLLKTVSSFVATQRLASWFNNFQRAWRQREKGTRQLMHQRGQTTGSIYVALSTDSRRPAAMKDFLCKHAGECCFLCFEKERSQFAVAVPCFRPTKPRRVRSLKRQDNGRFEPVYYPTEPKETLSECDAAVFERLKATCCECQGTWKKWLPFYGIISVEEVYVRYECRLYNSADTF